MAGATKEALRAATTEQLRRHSRAGRSQTAFSPKTLRAAGLLSVAGVDSFLTARCGDARNSPPWPQPKSLAAAPLVVSKQALSRRRAFRLAVFLLAALSGGSAFGEPPASAEKPSVLIVVGAPGEEEFGKRFSQWAGLWRKAAERGGVKVVTIGLEKTKDSTDR